MTNNSLVMNDSDILAEDEIRLFEDYAIAEAKLEEWKRSNRDRLVQMFKQHGVDSIETESLKITYVKEHTTRRLNLGVNDLKAFNVIDKNGEIVSEDRLVNETKTEASVRIKFKEA